MVSSPMYLISPHINVYGLTLPINYIIVKLITSAINSSVYVYGLASAIYYINVYGITSPVHGK